MGRKKSPDPIGQKFNRLTVVAPADDRGHNRFVVCRCECGEETVTALAHLKMGHTKSCGCLQKEKARQGKRILPFGEPAINALFLRYKHNATRRGRSFRLSKKWFRVLVQSNCHYCGANPNTQVKSNVSSKDVLLCNGIDRVNNNLGYFAGNCVSCCEKCNRLKGKFTKKDFLAQISKIYNYNEE